MGGQGGCERKFEVFVKFQKKKSGEGSFGGSGDGGQVGCVRRIEVIVKIQKKSGFRVGGRVLGSGWM